MNNSPIFVAPGVLSLSGRLPRVWMDRTDSLMIMDSYVGLHYDAVSNVGVAPPKVLEKSSTDYPPEVRRFLQMPALDPRIQQLTLDVTKSVPTPFAKAAAIELHLRTKYGYTLEMAAGGPDPVADFLFRVRQGHCEYFASAMTLMLRSIGIPARPVNGFLGGEYNDVSHQYVVRGSDAHTWVEVYFPGHGWATFDPTPSAGTEPSHRGLGTMAMWLDALHLFWTDWVVSFDFGRQFQVFRQVDRGSRQLTNDSRQYFRTRYDNLRTRIQSLHDGLASDPVLIPLGILLVTSAVLGILFAARIAYLLRQWRSKTRVRTGRANARDVTLAYDRFLALMARRGMQRPPAMTPAEFVDEIGDPIVAPLAREFTVAFEEARYGGATGRLPELYRLLARLERPDTVIK
jgi:transglutaminase-like putative cysteine protease